MMTAADIVNIAQEFHAEVSVNQHIRWMELGPCAGRWVLDAQASPSLLDALILARANTQFGYGDAAVMATGLTHEGVSLFQTTLKLFLCHDHTPEVSMARAQCRGVTLASTVYDLMKGSR